MSIVSVSMDPVGNVYHTHRSASPTYQHAVAIRPTNSLTSFTPVSTPSTRVGSAAVTTSAPAGSQASSFMVALYGTSSDYWVPREGEVGLLETIFTKSGSLVGCTVPVTSRPAEELHKNFSLPNGVRISLDNDLFKQNRTQFVLENMQNAMSQGVQISGSQLKAGMKDALPKLMQTEYLVLRYRDYSDYAVKKAVPHEAIRDGVIGFGRKFVLRGFVLRVGNEIGTLVPLTELQYIHAAELTHLTWAESDTSAGQPLCFLSEDQFKAAIAAADSVKTAVNTPQALDAQEGVNGQGVPSRGRGFLYSINPLNWKASIDNYVQVQYQRIGRTATRVLLIGGCVIGLYISVRGVNSFRRLVMNAAGKPVVVAKAPRPRLLTMMEELYKTRDLRIVFDFLLAPKSLRPN